MGAIEIAVSAISRAQQRIEVSAHNIANVTTPGYRASQPFAASIGLNQTLIGNSSSQTAPSIDFTIGKLRPTGNPLDVAIASAGFFVVRSGDAIFYTRNGQFGRDADGRLITANEMTVQSGAGDVTVAGPDIRVLADGMVLDGEEPISRLSIVDFADLAALRPAGAGLFAAPDGAAYEMVSPQVRQGMLEASNVSTADEMISIMAALRSAESGQRVVQIYDDLMGRAVTAFGQQ